MKYIIFILLTTSSVFSQEIKLKDSFWGGLKFSQYNKERSIGFGGENLKQAVSSSKEAVSEVNKYAISYNTGQLFQGISAYCIGWSLGGTYWRGEEVNKGMLAGGLVTAVLGIILTYKTSHSFLKKAVKIYNESIKDTTEENKPIKNNIKN